MKELEISFTYRHKQGADTVFDTLLAAYINDTRPYIWQSSRPTSWKQRIVTSGQLRPDRYDREVTRPLPQSASDFLASVPLGDALLIQDYGKGVCITTRNRNLQNVFHPRFDG